MVSEFENFDPAEFVKKQKEEQKQEDWKEWIQKGKIEQAKKEIISKYNKKLEKLKTKKSISKKQKKKKPFFQSKKFLEHQKKIRLLSHRLGKHLTKKRPIRQFKPFKPPIPMSNLEEKALNRFNQEQRWQSERIKKLKQQRINWAKRQNYLRQLELERHQLDRQKHNLLQAHLQMDKSQRFNILDTDDTILKPRFNIMKKREDSINILKPRVSILATREHGNDLKFF